MLRQLNRLPLTVLVAVLGTGACKTEPVSGDGDRLSEDNRAAASDSTNVAEAAAPRGKPAGGSVAGLAALSGKPKPIVTGQLAPRLSLLDVAGTHWSLETYLDPAGESSPKGFLVAFMASWCQYCTESLPTLVKLERANPDLAVITVTVDDRPELQKAELEKVRSAGLTGPVLVADEATVLAWIGGGKSVPRYYFVNHEGVVTGQDQGFGDNVAPMMPNQAKRALAD